MPLTGPSWQVMRLSRNRYWGHPMLIDWLLRFSSEARDVGWRGLLVGDISQPRGGPMLTGHVSHQTGLDVDLWLNEMPDRVLSPLARERTSARSMLHRGSNGRLSSSRIGSEFTPSHFRMIRLAARYPEVDRIFVHPVIKRELCRMEESVLDRSWLYKVRPYWGHHYHMHIRLSCPSDSPNCRPQDTPRSSDGCGFELIRWLRRVSPKQGVPVSPKKRVKRRDLRLSELPDACRGVLRSSSPGSVSSVTASFTNGKVILPRLSTKTVGYSAVPFRNPKR